MTIKQSGVDEQVDDDPAGVRLRLASMPSGPWCVYETFVADGTLAIGISLAPVPPDTVMVVYGGPTKDVATLAAVGLDAWRSKR